jgi:hypothetical protein
MRDYWYYVKYSDETVEVLTSCASYARILAQADRNKAGKCTDVISVSAPKDARGK